MTRTIIQWTTLTAIATATALAIALEVPAPPTLPDLFGLIF